ncbi:MAG: tRNA (adenosine(37)-N6)-dimethylallyltransferase MiaA [Parvularculaceae bacterium]
MPDENRKSVVFIAGPTASGKSAAALALAEEIDGEIVNADAIQVYRDLEILSARPRGADLAKVSHHLFGFIDGAERCSAGSWARRAAIIIDEVLDRRRPAIVVGGTGLYFKALEAGLSPIPDVPESVRAAAHRRLEEIGNAAFRLDVLSRDPAMARLDPGDTQRHLRAWEVSEATGLTLSSFQHLPRAPIVSQPSARVVLKPDRERLYKSCDDRFDRMMDEGALEESRRLLDRGLDFSLPVMKALGAAELIAHLKGELTLPDAVDLAKRNTRRFVKRQMTWFNRQAREWPQAADWRDALTTLQRR